MATPLIVLEAEGRFPVKLALRWLSGASPGFIFRAKGVGRVLVAHNGTFLAAYREGLVPEVAGVLTCTPAALRARQPGVPVLGDWGAVTKIVFCHRGIVAAPEWAVKTSEFWEAVSRLGGPVSPSGGE